MKTLHVSIYPPRGKRHAQTGGVASYAKNLITNVPIQRGDQQYVLCNKIDGHFESYDEDNIHVIRCLDRNLTFVWQIYNQVRNIKPNIIHIQQELGLYGNIFTAYLLQWLLIMLRRYKTIVTVHGVVSLRSINADFIKENNSHLPVWLVKSAFKIIFTPVCKRVNRVIVHEECFKKILIQEYGIDQDKISVIPHGVEDFETLPKEVACAKLCLDFTHDIILFMGYLTGYKGVDLLIEGFAEYVKENPNAFLILGAGKHPKLKNDDKYLEEYERLQKKAKKMIPETSYRWIGFIREEDISLYYSAADVSIYPYTIQMSSSGPMAIAIGHGKPFICSDVFDGFLKNKDQSFKRTAQDLALGLRRFFEKRNTILNSTTSLKKEKLWNAVGDKMTNIYQLT